MLSILALQSLLFTINDLLDLTRHETGNETSFNEPFDLPGTIEDAVTLYRIEAMRRQIQFVVDTSDCPQMVTGDSKKIRTVVSNLTANAGRSCQFDFAVGFADRWDSEIYRVWTDQRRMS
jgi:signal transduction histidine kinase